MSQEHDPMTMTTSIRKQRRTRQRSNQPVLVAAAGTKNSSLETDEQTIEIDNDSKQETETPTSESAPEKKAQPHSHLPKFFSRVDKSEQKEEEVIKARLARANTDKAGRDGQVSTDKAKTKSETKPQSKTKERREPLFKIRHFVGMTIYLFGAQFIMPYEFSLTHQLGMDHPFYTLMIFNNPLPLSPAIFLNIATLIIFLYILVKLDLLPNTASAKLRAEQKAREQQSKNHQNTAPAVKNVPPPMKLGVKGEDDDLYREYRANQRREKKR